MLMIRLARFGAKKKPFYRVVVIEKARAGKFFMCRSGSELPRRARANLEKSRDKMFDEIEKT